ncbi:MAG: ABC transporter permease [Ignavibacteriales bacterium]|nr:ABC transporter permease [Ignavibacteriales bacterium]
MKNILHIIRKEFLQLRQDRKMFGMSFVAPVFQLIILGYAATFDVTHIPTVVCDFDNSPSSRELVRNFTSTEYFRVDGYFDKTSEIDNQLDDGHASIAIIIPRGFEKKIGAGQSAPLQIIADGTETSTAGIGLSYASIIVSRYSQNILLESLVKRGSVTMPARVSAEFRVWYNPELKSRNFMVPGVLGLLLMVMTMLLTSLAIVKEKELGTLEQLVVTPIKPYQLIIGKLAPFFLIGVIDVVLVVFFASLVFSLPVKGGVLLLLFLSLIFLMTTLGLGLFISTISRTQQQAMMTAIFFFMLPMMFFSGFVFPIENMPLIIQYVSYVIPLRYYFVIVRGLFLKGVGMRILWPQALALLVFGSVILSMSVMRFQKKLG